jgi:hypothetical protein
MVKIGFTGTRHGMDRDQIAALWELLPQHFEGHHGDCVGGDEEFHHICCTVADTIIVHPPKDPKLRAYCKGDLILPEKDYNERNQDIVDACDLIIAAPETMTPQPRSGTWQTIRFAQKKGNLWKIVFPHGTVVEG